VTGQPPDGPVDPLSARRALVTHALSLAGGDRELAMGILALALEAVSDMERAACVTLASAALSAAGGDQDAAKVMLAPALEAIGALPYAKAPGKYRYGAAG